MAITNSQPLERAQAKIEGARGTAETTMTRWLIPIQGGLTWSLDIPQDSTKEQLHSYFMTENQGQGLPVCRLNYESVVSFEEIVWWACTILKGGSGQRTPTDLGGAPHAYAYPFDPSGTTDNLDTLSLKAGDGTNNYLFDRCAVNKAIFRWNPQSSGEVHWRMALEIFGRFNSAGVSFESLSDIARTKIPSFGTKFYSDATGGTIGTTQVTSKVRSGSITIDNQIEEKVWSENTTGPADDFARGEQLVTVETAMEFKDDVEFGYFRNGTRRQIRIVQTGSTISGANPYTLRWDFKRAKIVSFPPAYEGINKTVGLGMVAETDRANSVNEPVNLYVINAASAITA